MQKVEVLPLHIKSLDKAFYEWVKVVCFSESSNQIPSYVTVKFYFFNMTETGFLQKIIHLSFSEAHFKDMTSLTSRKPVLRKDRNWYKCERTNALSRLVTYCAVRFKKERYLSSSFKSCQKWWKRTLFGQLDLNYKLSAGRSITAEALVSNKEGT